MKKTSFSLISFLLVLCVVTSLLAPTALATDPSLKNQDENANTITAPVYPGVEPITLEATASLLIDMDNDQILHAENAQELRYPASITKIMTALLTLEAVGQGKLSLDTVITVPDNARYDLTEDSSTANIQPGEEITVKDLLYCLMVASANEAANILAVAVSGDIPSFVQDMNQRAQTLGMKNTHFVNPHGLHSTDHYTTAYDIYLMAKEAMTHAPFREIVSTSQYTTSATNLSEPRVLYNTNGLLSRFRYYGYEYPGTIGIKTGSTDEAGYCLCAAVSKRGATLVSVVLGCENIQNETGTNVQRKQFSESIRLLDWGYDNFSHVTLLDADSYLEEVPVLFSAEASHVVLRPTQSVEALVPGQYDEDKLDLRLTLKRDTATAPISTGDVLGSVTVIYGGEQYAEVDMAAVSDISFSPFMSFVHSVNAVLGNLFVRILLALAMIFFAVGLFRRWKAQQTEEKKAQRLQRQEEKKKAAQDRRQREEREYDLRRAERDHRRQEQALRREEEQLRRRREQEARRAEQERQRQEARRRQETERRRREEEYRHRRDLESRREESYRRQEAEERRRQEDYRRRQSRDYDYNDDRDRRNRRPRDRR